MFLKPNVVDLLHNCYCLSSIHCVVYVTAEWCQYKVNQVWTSEEWLLARFSIPVVAHLCGIMHSVVRTSLCQIVSPSFQDHLSQQTNSACRINITWYKILLNTTWLDFVFVCGLLARRNNFIIWIVMMILGLSSSCCEFGAFYDDIRYAIM